MYVKSFILKAGFIRIKKNGYTLINTTKQDNYKNVKSGLANNTEYFAIFEKNRKIIKIKIDRLTFQSLILFKSYNLVIIGDSLISYELIN